MILYIEKYAHDVDFQDVYASLSEGNQVEENDYDMHNNFLFHLGKMCIPQGERLIHLLFLDNFG